MKSYAICEVKSLAGDDPNGSFEAILSAATLDRDGEIIDAKAFEPLPDRIPIDIDHGMTVATTVGSGVPYYDGDVLKIKAAFSSIPRAQEIRTLVTEGHIDRMSVTFMGAERNTKDGVPHVEKAELLNAAFVPIPSNRDAAVLVAKAFVPTEDETKAGARNSTGDAERLQSIHDLAVSNGALCETKSHTPASGFKQGGVGAMADTLLGKSPRVFLGDEDITNKTPEPATASAETDPENEAAAPAAAKSPADVSAFLAAARAQAEAATVL